MKQHTIILGSCLALMSGFTAEAKQKRPNIILINADDLGRGMLSCYGQKHLTTPNIDRLMNQGMRFENGYASAYSAPSRASMLTGYNDCRGDKIVINRGGAYCINDTTKSASLEDKVNRAIPTFSEDDLHMAQVFTEAGYKSYAVGKLEWGFLSTRKQMADRGWTGYYGYLDHHRCHGFYPTFLFENGDVTMIEGNTDAHAGVTLMGDSPEAEASRKNRDGRVQYSEDLFLAKAKTIMRENKDNPFFLYYASLLPHGPVAIQEIHPELKNAPGLTELEKEYGSMVKMLDNSVGELMSELDKLGIADNTMIIFIADNGHALHYNASGSVHPRRENGELFDGYEHKYNSVDGNDVFNGNNSMSGYKRSNLEGGINVPFVYYWKGHIEAKSMKEITSVYDMLPTFADMLNVKLKVEKSGESMCDVLFKGRKQPKNRYVVTDSQEGGPMLVDNTGWKLRYYYKKNCFELFDLNNDPLEQNNLIKEYPKKAKAMEAMLDAECEIGYMQPRYKVTKFVPTKK